MPKTFEDSDYYTGPLIDTEMIARAEALLGVRLPASYVELLAERNGGVPRRRCYPTPFRTSWAADHFEISAILGVGGEWGVDSASQGSRYMIAEWGHPGVGVVICDMPSGGHDTVMLDYRNSGPEGEPVVSYIDQDRIPRQIAESFDAFLAGLASCDRFRATNGS